MSSLLSRSTAHPCAGATGRSVVGHPFAGGVAPVASDSFNRANSSDLGETDGAGHAISGGAGLAWTEHSGTWDIESNRLRVNVTGGNVTVDTGQSNVAASMIINSPGGAGNEYHALVVRYADETHLWAAAFTVAGNKFVISENDGGWVERASATPSINADIDHTVLVYANGTTITAYLNGANELEYASATSSQTATRCGARSDSIDNSQFDNFHVWKRAEYPDG